MSKRNMKDLKAASVSAEEGASVRGGKPKATLATKSKQLDSQDRMGNFEIQDLMSTYNQSETR